MKPKQLVIKQLRILSLPEKSAKLITFHPQRNLITGKNDVGKSSIIKSIYHTLGADVAFDGIWGKADAVTLLTFTFGEDDFGIVRSRNNIGVFDANGVLIRSFDSIIKGLSPFLAKLFNNKLQLRQSQSTKRIPVSPAIQFLPYYIDQDKSWFNTWNAFEGLGAFSSFKRDLIEFVSGIKPNQYYLLSEKIEKLTANLSELEKELSVLSAAKKEVEKHMPKTSFDVDIKIFKKEIDLLLVKLNLLKSKEHEYRRNLIKQKNQESFIDNQIAVVSNSIKEINKDYTHSLKDLPDEITCPTCNAIYENSMISRFGLLDDVDMCRKLIADYLEDKKGIGKKISQLELQLNLQVKKVKEITELLNEKKGKIKLADLIQNESAKQIKDVFTKSQSGYAAQIANDEHERKGLKEDRSKLNNKERKDSIVDRFNSLVDSFLIKLNVHTLNSNGFSDIPTAVKAQGSDTPRALLAYYYAILYTSQEFTDLPIFPLVIDSPNQQDQDANNRHKIIKFIFDNTPKDYQLILGTVDLHGVEYEGHTISPDVKLKLLNADEYEDTYEVVSPLLDKLHDSLIEE